MIIQTRSNGMIGTESSREWLNYSVYSAREQANRTARVCRQVLQLI
jgi:hypothetical protein